MAHLVNSLVALFDPYVTVHVDIEQVPSTQPLPRHIPSRNFSKFFIPHKRNKQNKTFRRLERGNFV